MRVRLRLSYVFLTSLLALPVGCGNDQPDEKVDAGQRKYCDARCLDAIIDLGATDRAGSSGLDLGAIALDTMPDQAGYRDVVAQADQGPETAARTDSDLDGSPHGGDLGGHDAGGGDRAGDLGGTEDAADGGPGRDLGPDLRPDAGLDARDVSPNDGQSDATDAPAERLDLASDGVDVASDTVDSPPDTPGSPDAPIVPDAAPCRIGGVGWARVWQDSTASDPTSAPAPATLASIGAGGGGALWATGKHVSGTFKPGAGPALTYTGFTDSSQGTPIMVPDAFLLKLDGKATGEGGLAGSASEAFVFADAYNNSQQAMGVAVASAGNVAVLGSFKGEIDFTNHDSEGVRNQDGIVGVAGVDFLTASQQVSFYAVIDGASTGAFATPVKAHMVDVGGNGQITAIGSNPTQNAFAFCGRASKAVPDWGTGGSNKGVITGGSAVYGDTGDPSNPSDIVVAKIDAATGLVVWGKQFGGAGNQICDSVVIDTNGDVIIAGGYTGTLDFGGAAGALPVVADGSASLLYVARLDGAAGTGVAAKTWGGSGRTSPYGLTVDGNGAILVAGSLGGNIDLGGGIAITNQGLADAFVLKLSSSLAPTWGKSFGDALNDQSVLTAGVDSVGSVFIAGSYKGAMAGLGLTATGDSAADGFLAQLSPYDGSSVCARSYGSAAGTELVATIGVFPASADPWSGAVVVGGSFSSGIQLDVAYPRASSSQVVPFVARMHE